MKIIQIICFLLFLLPFKIISAQCPEGNVSLQTQQEVYDFIATYPNCTTIDGIFTVGNSEDSLFSDITDISGLTNLTTINSNCYKIAA